jgi:hypothetical protein
MSAQAEGVSMTMNREAAKVFAAKMRAEGKSLEEISAALAVKGVLSARTGKPLTFGGVSALIHGRSARSAPKARRRSRNKAKAKANNMTEVIRAMLQLNKDDATKLALIALVVEL